MTNNFLEKYKEEDSLSSDSGDDVGIVKRESAKQTLDPQPSEQSQEIEKSERKTNEWDKISPYTFNPRSIIEQASGPSTSRTHPSKSFKLPVTQYNSSTKNVGYPNLGTPREGTFSTVIKYNPITNYMQYKKDLEHSPIEGRGDSFKSFQYNIKDESGFADFKSENEYREFVKEFNNEFGDRQRDVPEVLRQLGSRIKRLQNLGRDFSVPNADMLLLKTRLLHEIEATQSDLSDANNTITLLMNDRASIKDKYCHLKLRNKEMKNFTKKIEENVRA